MKYLIEIQQWTTDNSGSRVVWSITVERARVAHHILSRYPGLTQTKRLRRQDETLDQYGSDYIAIERAVKLVKGKMGLL